MDKSCKLLLPNHQIQKIKYFTARVNSRPNDLGIPVRQETYLRAIRTLPNIEIVLGHFLTQEVNMPVSNCLSNNQQYVRVTKTEEKGSDVNMATHLLSDGYKNKIDVQFL